MPQPGEPFKILIIDEQPAVRAGLTVWISGQTDMIVCGEADDTVLALELVASTTPHLVLIDVSMKSGSGLDLIKRIRGHSAAVRLLVFSWFSEDLFAERAKRAGANGFISKNVTARELIAAVRHVLAGKAFLCGIPSGRASHADPTELSDRELQVYMDIGLGLPCEQIAQKMHVSVKTVETYRCRIKRKLHIASSSELIRRAVYWVTQDANAASLEPRSKRPGRQ